MVLLVAEDESRILQELDNGVGFAVDHVCPFMNFISQYSQNDTKNDGPLVGLLDRVIGCHQQSHRYEHGHGVG